MVEIGVQLLFWVGQWSGGWSDKKKVVLNSVEVEVGVELAKKFCSKEY